MSGDKTRKINYYLIHKAPKTIIYASTIHDLTLTMAPVLEIYDYHRHPQ